MQLRSFWINHIESLWGKRSVIWLPGVRRVGKTTLTQSLKNVEYFDCELPRQRLAMEDPQAFLDGLKKKRIVLDEIHRLQNPSELLKIAADHYPSIRVIATGSSTLGATHKFRDSLAGRKAQLWLTPAMSADLKVFGDISLETRLYRGGLPPYLLSQQRLEREYQEWMDAYWAKDIQELFRLERRHSFIKFVELLLAASGGIFEATRYARPCEVSRTTIANYLAVLEATFLVHIIRPYSTGKTAEIVAAPKVYGFDTGFVCEFRGWSTPRRDDMGLLWEHYVLNEIHARFPDLRVCYWRNKQGCEVDFVIARRRQSLVALECKWSADDFDPAGLKAFALRYPKAYMIVVAQNIQRGYSKRFGESTVKFTNLEGLEAVLHAGTKVSLDPQAR